MESSNYFSRLSVQMKSQKGQNEVDSFVEMTRRCRKDHFVNDFISNVSYNSSDLSLSKIYRIHRNNAKKSYSKRQCSTTNITSHNEDRGSDLNFGYDSDVSESQFIPENIVKMKNRKWTPDILLTEEFLGKTMKNKAERRNLRSYFYMYSIGLFRYLSTIIGHENMIEIRRKATERKFPSNENREKKNRKYAHNRQNMFLPNFSSNELQISGSKAEGLNMKKSDTDFMHSFAEACEDNLNENVQFTYQSLEFDEHPGYVTVQNLKKGGYGTTHVGCFGSSDLKCLFEHVLNQNLPFTVKQHGPSVCPSVGGERDVVYCLKSPLWPKIAEEWKQRIRHFGWPLPSTIRKITSRGCHLVPISYKSDALDNDKWRLSFSDAEKQLISTFNQVQLLIYGLLKIVLKEIIETEDALKDLLCSYFLKTTLFWVIEETNAKLWNPRYTILCFHICIDRLISFVLDDNCPNYFVPINNMFSRRFKKEEREALLNKLCSISDKGIDLISRAPSMCNFVKYVHDPYTKFELDRHSEMAEKREATELYLDLIKHYKKMINFYMQHSRLNVKDRIWYAKSFVRDPLLKRSVLHHICHFMNLSNPKMNNRLRYSSYKLVISMILNGSQHDRISGKAMLAALFYSLGLYHQCLKVIEDAFTDLKRRVVHMGFLQMTSLPRFPISDVDIGNTVRFYSTLDIQFPFSSKLFPKELTFYFNISPTFKMHDSYRENYLFPEIYFSLMRFLCYRQLNERVNRERAFQNLLDVHLLGSQTEREFQQTNIKNIVQLMPYCRR